MRAMKRVVACALAVLFLAGSVSLAEEQYIRVGSFNIANLGSSQTGGYERSLVSLVNIIRQMDADVLALQEVEPTDFGSGQVERLVKLLNKAARYDAKPLYDYVIADEHTGDETTAFLWRDPVSLESEVVMIEHTVDPDGDGLPAFQRVPHYAFFNAHNYDFYLVNCHLYTKIEGLSSEGRADEFVAIVAWLKQLTSEDEKDAIVVGDFNRFLGGKSAWKKLMVQQHAQWFRFPLLEAIKDAKPGFDPATNEAPSDDCSTTTAAKRSIYDQILLSKGSEYEFTATPKLDKDVGIVAFDREDQFKWVTATWTDATRMLSDHRPIWIRLRVGQTDDD